MIDGSGLFQRGNGLGVGHFKAVEPAEEVAATQEVSGAPETQGGTQSGAQIGALGGDTGTVDDVDLSPEAEVFLAEAVLGESGETRPGKSGQSKAHMAFAALQDHPELASMPFGKIVSTFAKTGSVESLLPKPQDQPDDVAGAATEEGGEILAGVPVEGTVDAIGAETPTTIDPLVLPDTSAEDQSLIDLLTAIANPDEEDGEDSASDVQDDETDPET